MLTGIIGRHKLLLVHWERSLVVVHVRLDHQVHFVVKQLCLNRLPQHRIAFRDVLPSVIRAIQGSVTVRDGPLSSLLGRYQLRFDIPDLGGRHVGQVDRTLSIHCNKVYDAAEVTAAEVG